VRLTTGSGEVAVRVPAVTLRRYAMVAIAVVAMAWALGGEWVSARHHVPENHFIDLLGGLSFLVSGIVALSRRPGNAIGKLLLVFGFIWYLRNWSSLGVPGLAALGAISGYLGPPLLVQIMLAYPTGKLSSTFDRVVVCIVYAAAGAASIIGLLVFSPHAAGCARCAWEPALFPSRAAYLATAQAYQHASIVLAVLVVVAAWRRTYRATRAERRDLAAWWIALRLLGAVFLLGAFSSPFPARDSFAYLLWELQSLLLASLPAIIVWGLLSARLARSAVSDLVMELQRPQPPGKLQESLARAIGDPSLTLAYARERQDGWVDLSGQEVALPLPGEGPQARAVTVAERDGRPLAALIHDPALEPGLVRSAAAAAGMAIENERLQAEVRAQLEEVLASRQRIVEAADRERRRVERNLHDGAQQRLAALALSLAILRDKTAGDDETATVVARASADLRQAMREIRELARGIHPAILTEDGLTAAVESLADRSPVPVQVTAEFEARLPEPVETAAYFVVAESLANVAKYAQASSASVSLSRCNGTLRVEVADDGVGGADPSQGSGLRGLEDRVCAVRGSFRVKNEPGQGTRVIAEIPCAG
jgi:signal transduction histidine kinase